MRPDTCYCDGPGHFYEVSWCHGGKNVYGREINPDWRHDLAVKNNTKPMPNHMEPEEEKDDKFWLDDYLKSSDAFVPLYLEPKWDGGTSRAIYRFTNDFGAVMYDSVVAQRINIMVIRWHDDSQDLDWAVTEVPSLFNLSAHGVQEVNNNLTLIHDLIPEED